MDARGTKHMSRGWWLATRQEARIKNFVLKQLERQLTFERGCDAWLSSECMSREQREEQLGCFTEGLADSSKLSRLAGALDAFRDEDRRTENGYTQQNVGWWQDEEQSINSLFEGISHQSTTDLASLTHHARVTYDARVCPLVHKVIHSFQCRRMEAETLLKHRLSKLQEHHDAVLQRQVRSLMAKAPRWGLGADMLPGRTAHPIRERRFVEDMDPSADFQNDFFESQAEERAWQEEAYRGNLRGLGIPGTAEQVADDAEEESSDRGNSDVTTTTPASSQLWAGHASSDVEEDGADGRGSVCTSDEALYRRRHRRH